MYELRPRPSFVFGRKQLCVYEEKYLDYILPFRFQSKIFNKIIIVGLNRL